MNKKILVCVLLLQLPFGLYCAAAFDDVIFNESDNSYTDSQMIRIVKKRTRQEIVWLLDSLLEEVNDFLESEKTDREIQKEQVKLQKKQARAFLLHKAESERRHPEKKIERPCRKSLAMPLSMELLKNKLYKEREAALAKINTILTFYNSTQQLVVPLELLSEALGYNKKKLNRILREEEEFYRAVVSSRSSTDSTALPLDPSSGLVLVPIPPLSAQTENPLNKRIRRSCKND